METNNTFITIEQMEAATDALLETAKEGRRRHLAAARQESDAAL